MARRPVITRLPRHRPDIISLTEPFESLSLEAGERLSPPEPPARWQPWALAAALLLHVLAVALALYTRERGLPQEQDSPPSFAMVFDHGGSSQTAAPPAPRQGPLTIAQSPPPPPPPPPQPQTEVNVNVPLNALASLPPPQPHPQPRPAPHPRPAPPHYAMMLNGMSYGNPSPVMPAPPAHPGMNFDLAQSDSQAVFAPELTIKGDAGADWDAALNRWVEAHKYYPQAALEQNQQGNVEIEFTVDRQGNVTGLHMLNGSGSPFLDQAWLGLFQDAQLPAFPPGTKPDHITVDATMHFELIQ